MAGSEGYSVGGLKLAFNALDQTSDDFKKLATNLRAVANLINRISTADLGKFTANVKQITQAFNPFLTKIEKSSDGIKKLNDSVSKVGVGNVSSVAQNFDDLQNKAQGAAESAGKFKVEINSADEAVRGAADSFSDFENKTKEVIDTFDKAQAQIAKLTKEMLNLHFATGNLDNGAIQEIRDLTAQISASQNAVKQALMSEEELVIEKFKDIQATRKQRIAYLEAKLAMGASGKQARQYAKELAELRKQDGQVGKKSGFQKFLGQIKRVAIYRTIRTGLKAITSAFKDGINALAQFDSGINKTMSQLTTSFTVMKLSVSMALVPLLQSITPIIQQISVGFANMANTVSQAMSTTGKYIKINTDRLLNYNKAANVFDFDKFRALNKGGDASSLLSEEIVDESEEKLYKVRNTINGIKDIIFGLWGTIKTGWETIVKPILEILFPVITDVVQGAGKIVKGVGDLITKLNELGILKPLIYAVLTGLAAWGGAKVIGGIANLLKSLGNLKLGFIAVGAAITLAAAVWESWGDMNAWQRLIAIIGVATTAVLGLAIAFGAFHSAWSLGAAVVGITAGIVAVVGSINAAKSSASSNKVSYFANGGMPDKGSLFVAGEGGAEFVYNMPSGQSGVANVQQIAQAVYQGTYQATMDWWKSAKNDIPQFQGVSDTGIYQIVKGEMRRRGERPVKA